MESVGLISSILDWIMKLKGILIPKKADLRFEEVEAFHWFNEKEDLVNHRSGIQLTMFIVNRGDKLTTIRKIDMISMEPDYLDQLYEIRTEPIEIGVGKDLKYSTGFSFYGSLLTMDSVEFILEITHTEGKEKLPVRSELNDKSQTGEDKQNRKDEKDELKNDMIKSLLAEISYNNELIEKGTEVRTKYQHRAFWNPFRINRITSAVSSERYDLLSPETQNKLCEYYEEAQRMNDRVKKLESEERALTIQKICGEQTRLLKSLRSISPVLSSLLESE